MRNLLGTPGRAFMRNAVVVGALATSFPANLSPGVDPDLVGDLREIRAIEDSLHRLSAYDKLVDSLPEAPRPPASDKPAKLSEEEMTFLDRQVKKLPEVSDALVEAAELVEEMKLEFDETKKLSMARKAQRRVEKFEKWCKDEDTLLFARKHGTHLGDGFYAFFMGRRSVKQSFINKEMFLFGVTYIGAKPWKVAEVSWELNDLLGDTIKSGSGKLSPKDVSGVVYIASIESNLFDSGGADHVRDWADATVKATGKPKVVWSEK